MESIILRSWLKGRTIWRFLNIPETLSRFPIYSTSFHSLCYLFTVKFALKSQWLSWNLTKFTDEVRSFVWTNCDELRSSGYEEFNCCSFIITRIVNPYKQFYCSLFRNDEQNSLITSSLRWNKPVNERERENQITFNLEKKLEVYSEWIRIFFRSCTITMNLNWWKKWLKLVKRHLNKTRFWEKCESMFLVLQRSIREKDDDWEKERSVRDIGRLCLNHKQRCCNCCLVLNLVFEMKSNMSERSEWWELEWRWSCRGKGSQDVKGLLRSYQVSFKSIL
jgi:hypothetical protein